MTDHPPPQFDEEELAIWSSLATLLEWLPAALDEQLERDAGVTHFEYGILFALAHAPDGVLRMSTLAGYARSSLSRLSRAAARLESRDWIIRAPDPSDGRYTLARLTTAGRAEVDVATPGHVELVRRVVFGSLTPTQRRQLGAISDRITRALRPDGAWRPPSGRDDPGITG